MKTQTRLLAALLLFSTFPVLGLSAQEPAPPPTTETAQTTQGGDPPDRVARLSYMEGAVSFEPAGENDWSQATLNYPLTTGDRLWTDVNARAELETGNVAIRMSQQTDLTTTNLTDQLMQFGVAQGSVRLRVFDLRPGNSIEVDTPSAAITIVQAGSYRVDVYPNQSMAMLTVNSGSAQVTGNNLNQTVQSGQAAEMTGSNPVQLQWVAVAGPDDFDQWSNQRDQKYMNAQARQYVSPEVPGYYDLDGYGTWDTVPQYGPIWYPTTVAVGWVPYRYGRWVWVDPWGWTWVDSAPWGFAPFHYGRWVQIGPRWGWLPGPIAVAPIYGPAFVAFVGGPAFSVGFGVGGVAAWFPLGPGEPFYPWYHYSPGYLRQINVTNVRNINITNITNVTNINNIHYRYQTVATTAVSANTFRSGQPVERNIVKVNPQQIARAQVIPHPQINPDRSAILAGNPTHPPVSAQRPAIVQHAPVTTARNVPPNPTETRTPPAANRPTTEASRPTTPVQQPNRPAATPHEVAPSVANRVPSAPPATRPSLIARTPPPAAKLPYQEKAPAMAEHPGRPLEPQQRANIQAGRPAGPMQDREFPPHAEPVRPQSTPHSAPSPHGGSSKH